MDIKRSGWNTQSPALIRGSDRPSPGAIAYNLLAAHIRQFGYSLGPLEFDSPKRPFPRIRRHIPFSMSTVFVRQENPRVLSQKSIRFETENLERKHGKSSTENRPDEIRHQ